MAHASASTLKLCGNACGSEVNDSISVAPHHIVPFAHTHAHAFTTHTAHIVINIIFSFLPFSLCFFFYSFLRFASPLLSMCARLWLDRSSFAFVRSGRAFRRRSRFVYSHRRSFICALFVYWGELQWVPVIVVVFKCYSESCGGYVFLWQTRNNNKKKIKIISKEVNK